MQMGNHHRHVVSQEITLCSIFILKFKYPLYRGFYIFVLRPRIPHRNATTTSSFFYTNRFFMRIKNVGYSTESFIVSPRFKSEIATGQSARADKTHHSFSRHFYPTVQNLSLRWTLAQRRERARVREKIVPNTWVSATAFFVCFCRTFRNLLFPDTSIAAGMHYKLTNCKCSRELFCELKRNRLATNTQKVKKKNAFKKLTRCKFPRNVLFVQLRTLQKKKKQTQQTMINTNIDFFPALELVKTIF